LERSKEKTNAVKTVAVGWPAKQAEPFGFASIFGSTFCIKAKGGITTISMNNRKEERLLQQPFAKLGVTNQKMQER
jgi:hypothetical protein